MNPRPMPVTMHLLTLKGFVMQPELVAGLASLASSDGEYSLHLTETRAGIAAFLRCRTSTRSEERWAVEHDPNIGRYTYHTVFETESVPEIVEAIKLLLDMPGIAGQAE